MTQAHDDWELDNKGVPKHIIIWLDRTIGVPTDYLALKKAFRHTTDPRIASQKPMEQSDFENLLRTGEAETVLFEGVEFLLICVTDVDRCLKAVKQHEHRRIFLITSGSLGRKLLPKLVKLYSHVLYDPITRDPYQSIYMFCHELSYNMGYAWSYTDHFLPFTFDKDLLERLTSDISEYFILRATRQRDEVVLASKENLSQDEMRKIEHALVCVGWAKILRTRYDQMRQFPRGEPGEVRETRDMRKINALIEEIIVIKSDMRTRLNKALGNDGTGSDEDQGQEAS